MGMATNVTTYFNLPGSHSFSELDQRFMVEPIASWTTFEMMVFPWLFIIPAEILGLISSAIIYMMGSAETDLPHGKYTGVPLSLKSWCYIWFNRLVVLPFLSWLIVKNVWSSKAVIYDMEKLNWLNGLVAFLVVFAGADFTYFVSHQVVHKYRFLYSFIHKHHHQEAGALADSTPPVS